jgi:tryptophan synthase alpha chain
MSWKMNKLDQTFRTKKNAVLSAYFTAGFPALEDTQEVMKSLQDGGADIIEVGIPFSDPLADGPTIQRSNKRALDNGISLRKILDQIYLVKDEIRIPVLLMGYLNPIYQYGIEKFCNDCSKAGVSGLIIPDLPILEFQKSYKEIFDSSGLYNIFLITPETSEERIREIEKISHGFIYMVSASSTTGAKKGLSEDQITYFKRIRHMNLRTPCLVGFGISDHQSFQVASQYAQGAIIGSAIVNVLEKSKDIREEIIAFIRSIKGI